LDKVDIILYNEKTAYFPQSFELDFDGKYCNIYKVQEEYMQVRELAPIEVFSYFTEIASIPRGSGNTAKIADYCVRFAKEHGLRVLRDSADNVIIFKDGTPGYEDHEAVLLQGHLDMVCEKEAGCIIDMETEGVELCTDGSKVWASGTTLGADDGIAMAYILAVLASDQISHPPIQAIFTSDEEIGMLGARALDTNVLSAKRLINLDSELENVLYVSCAGGVRTQCDIPITFVQAEQEIEQFKLYEITVEGLAGGHSGIEIHRYLTNGIRLLASALEQVETACDIRLVDICGGGKENAIPKEARATVCVSAKQAALFQERIADYDALVKKDLSMTEPGVCIRAELLSDKKTFPNGDEKLACLTQASTKQVIFALHMTPDGVYKMNPDIEGMVQTSLNLGTAYINGPMLTYKYLIRSNTASGKQLLVEYVRAFVRYLGGTMTTASDYPAWEYRKDSKLREVAYRSFCKVYGQEPEITSIHAGLECGILSGKMPDVDMISFGPTLADVHTPNERMNVASAQRTWACLLEILAAL
jgi:dipeptidase D